MRTKEDVRKEVLDKAGESVVMTTRKKDKVTDTITLKERGDGRKTT